jgi:hypothetical protein
VENFLKDNVCVSKLFGGMNIRLVTVLQAKKIVYGK